MKNNCTGQDISQDRNRVLHWKGITLFVCFSHVQRDARLHVLGDLTLCRWEEMIFKLPVCKLARKWQHCHCSFCSKHPIKLAVYTFLPDSCLPAEGSWAANEAQRRDWRGKAGGSRMQTQPTAVAEGGWAGPGGILPGPVVNERHIWLADVSPSRLWAMGSQDR